MLGEAHFRMFSPCCTDDPRALLSLPDGAVRCDDNDACAVDGRFFFRAVMVSSLGSCWPQDALFRGLSCCACGSQALWVRRLSGGTVHSSGSWEFSRFLCAWFSLATWLGLFLPLVTMQNLACAVLGRCSGGLTADLVLCSPAFIITCRCFWLEARVRKGTQNRYSYMQAPADNCTPQYSTVGADQSLCLTCAERHHKE